MKIVLNIILITALLAFWYYCFFVSFPQGLGGGKLFVLTTCGIFGALYKVNKKKIAVISNPQSIQK